VRCASEGVERAGGVRRIGLFLEPAFVESDELRLPILLLLPTHRELDASKQATRRRVQLDEFCVGGSGASAPPVLVLPKIGSCISNSGGAGSCADPACAQSWLTARGSLDASPPKPSRVLAAANALGRDEVGPSVPPTPTRTLACVPPRIGVSTPPAATRGLALSRSSRRRPWRPGSR
jgi:hypothetical protein